MSNVLQFPVSKRPRLPVPGIFSAVQQIPSHQLELVKCVANELITTATWVAATAGVVNRCYLEGKATSPRFLQGCLPPDPVMYQALRKESNGYAEAVLRRCSELHFYLRAAREALRDTLEAKQLSASAKRKQQMKTCDLWQASADTALLAIYALEDTIGYQRLSLETEHMRTLCGALIAARSGGTPFQNEGIPALPDWVDRRAARRCTVNMFAQLTSDSNKVEVFVTNVSSGGLGIDYADNLKDGSLVSIRLHNGRTFVGRVAWCIGRRAGITFRRSLRPDDPLLAG